jgi:hypothetical protein
VKHKGHPLRFCKTGERQVEEAFKRVFSPRSPGWKKVGKLIRDPTLAGGRAVEQADKVDEPQL